MHALCLQTCLPSLWRVAAALLTATDPMHLLCRAANILVRYLGEEGSSTPIQYAVSMANPFNLVRALRLAAGCKSCSPNMQAKPPQHAGHF